MLMGAKVFGRRGAHRTRVGQRVRAAQHEEVRDRAVGASALKAGAKAGARRRADGPVEALLHVSEGHQHLSRVFDQLRPRVRAELGSLARLVRHRTQ